MPSYSPSVSFAVNTYIPGTDVSVLYRRCFNEIFIFIPSQDADYTGFSNGPAISTDGERDNTGANPHSCVLHDTFLPGESPVTGKGSKSLLTLAAQRQGRAQNPNARKETNDPDHPGYVRTLPVVSSVIHDYF